MPKSDHRQRQRHPIFNVLTVTSRERKVTADFAEDFYMAHAAEVEILLQVWSKLRAWQEARKSRKFLTERSGIACKLWYALHESPALRLGAWTIEKDTALRRLATGLVDPKLVKKWHRIAKRMPSAGKTSSSLSYSVPDSAKRGKHALNLYARRRLDFA